MPLTGPDYQQLATKIDNCEADLRVARALTPKARRRGLLDASQLPHDLGLLLPKAAVIHMWRMQIPIDAVFINSRGRVKKIATNLQPGPRLCGSLRGLDCLELAAGAADQYNIRVGTKLDFAKTGAR